MYAVIFAGGGGTRLWPRSRQSEPKQFVDITGTGRTMIQATADRLQGLVNDDQLYVVTGARLAPLAAAQIAQLPNEHLVIEPSGRNTAPAIGLACAHLYRRDPQAVAAFLPADHIIPDVAAFHRALRQAAATAAQGYLVTLGVTPLMPHTGYGYIKAGTSLATHTAQELPVYLVERFLEKPNRATAEAFLAEGSYFWNAGIFICRVDCMLKAMEQHLPAVYSCLQRIMAGLDTPQADAIFANAWDNMPNISIDYGIMERAQSVAMVPLDAGWNDVGSWDALEGVLAQDAQHNYVARGETLAIDSQGNIVYSDKRIVALIDVNDLVVVETDNALLIGQKHKMQRVREVVEQLRNQGKIELL